MDIPTEDEIAARLKATLRVVFGPREFSPTTHYVNDFGADSLDLVELTLMTEDAFDIEISDHDAENIHTVGDTVAYLQKRLSKILAS